VERTDDERLADVRRLLEAARRVYERRSELLPALVETTGLSAQGVGLGFESLERQASDGELRALVAAAGHAKHVHVVMSANVFVAPLRALALARAAAPFVTLRPSPRDPILARALVDAAEDPAIALVTDRDVASSDADVVHVYGRDETIEQVRARVRAGSRVVGHGAGLGVALVSAGASVQHAAEAIALDVVAFDQRGCLSPRVVLVEGDATRARLLAEDLHAALAALDARVPRGVLSPDEARESVRWKDTIAFAGQLWIGSGHAVGLLPGAGVAQAMAPTGRHALIVAASDPADVRAALAPMAHLVVTLGCDNPGLATAVAPAHARLAELGRMQRPPLDGPVDRRTAGDVVAVT
jgi:hypothetical protein